MKKRIVGFLFLVIMSIDTYAKTLDEALLNSTFEGNIRAGYQNQTPQSNDGISDNEYALGLNLHFETAPYHGLQVGTTLFTTYGNGKEGFEGVPFFDENNDDYALLGEAYLKGTLSNTTFILGRQNLDTPFADSDDLGMVPNTFEAYTLINKDLKDTTIFLSQVQSWSGVDSDAPSTFTELNGNKGMQVVGVIYQGWDNSTFSGWFYNLSDTVKVSYFQADYEAQTDKYTYGGILQYACQDYEDSESSTIYGAAAFFVVKNIGLTTTIAYNRTKGAQADNFFGGGPFVTSAEHNTIQEAGPDGNVLLYTLQWDASVAGMEGVTFVVNVDGHHDELYHAEEYDIGMAYSYSDSLGVSAVYSDIDDEDTPYRNLRIFANYSF
jgi:hypothetical protein